MDDRKAYMQNYRKEYKAKKCRVTITMTQEEYALFKTETKVTGKSIPETIKQMALCYKQAIPIIPAVNEKKHYELRLLLRNMANNINQIAHNLNLNRHLYGPESNMHAYGVVVGLQDQLAKLEGDLKKIFITPGG